MRELLILLSILFGVSGFNVASISYEELLRGEQTQQLEHVLAETGIVAVTEITGYADLRKATLRDASLCSKHSTAAKSSIFEDSTLISTIATTAASSGLAQILHGSSDQACVTFDHHSQKLRSLISQVSKVFIQRINGIYDVNEEPYLSTANKNRTFHSVQEITLNGEQLEHFHSYSRGTSSNISRPTIDFHTDQGFFIAFSPAVLVSGDGTVTHDTKSKFYIQLKNGQSEVVDFRDGNSLIFMMGDGVNQFINPELTRSSRPIRATPHALVMPSLTSNETRVWYGRMFLPPGDAIHKEHGVTYGKLRQLLIDAPKQVDDAREQHKILSLGCSRKLYARQLQEDSCSENQMWCWMRCMDFPEDANPELCEEKGLKFACTSQYNQLWRTQDGHGDYNPMCTSATSWVTPAPTAAPRASTCSDNDFALFTLLGKSARDSGFVELIPNKFVLRWVVIDGEVHGKLSYNGRVGWIAFGFSNTEDALHGGMLGGDVVMGVRQEDDSLSANEYHIHPKLTAFRHWSTPITSTLRDKEITTDGCFTALSFRGASIGPRTINLENVNNMMYAVHTSTYLMGYHGFYPFRGHLAIDFRNADALASMSFPKEPTANATDSATPEPTVTCTYYETGKPCSPHRRRLFFGGAIPKEACVCK